MGCASVLEAATRKQDFSKVKREKDEMQQAKLQQLETGCGDALANKLPSSWSAIVSAFSNGYSTRSAHCSGVTLQCNAQ
jgi:hypothetical protein